MSELATVANCLVRSRQDTTVPGCVAQPPDLVPYDGQMVPRRQLYPDPYRGWDHRNCSHPTQPPGGMHRCPGDNGCEVRLPPNVDRCPFHADTHWSATPAERWEQMMGASRSR